MYRWIKVLFVLAGIVASTLAMGLAWYCLPVTVTEHSDRSDRLISSRMPRFMTVRAEGKTLAEFGLDAFGYVLKWRYKRKAAPDWKVRYFALNKKLLTRLAEPQIGDRSLTVGAVGDIMWIRTDWDEFLSSEVKEELGKIDVLSGNLESVVANFPQSPKYLPDGRRFNSPPGLIDSFSNGGTNLFHLISFANNHTYDFGEEAALETVAFLKSRGIAVSGLRGRSSDEKNYVVREFQGTRVGYIAATYGYNDLSVNPVKTIGVVIHGLAPESDGSGDWNLDLSAVKEALKQMKEDGVQLKIVSVHWGTENEYYPTERTMVAARQLVHYGADVIVGSHPHVIQPSEVCFVNGYFEQSPASRDMSSEESEILKGHGCLLEVPGEPKRKALVMYSLGNFLTNVYSMESRIGILSKIALRAERGVVDWHPLPGVLVFNDVNWWKDEHELILMSSYLKKICSGGDADLSHCNEIKRMVDEIGELQWVANFNDDHQTPKAEPAEK